MNITQDFGDASFVIRAYDETAIVINETRLTNSLVVMPDHLNPRWEPQNLDSLKEQHLQQVADLNPELVLLGTGPKLIFPDALVRHFFLQRRIGIEFMDTPAACRTFNILMSEGRKVACALLMGAP